MKKKIKKVPSKAIARKTPAKSAPGKPVLFELEWRNRYLTSSAKTIDDMIAEYDSGLQELRAMKKAGVTLDRTSGIEDDYATLITTDAKVAKKFKFHKPEPHAE